MQSAEVGGRDRLPCDWVFLQAAPIGNSDWLGRLEEAVGLTDFADTIHLF